MSTPNAFEFMHDGATVTVSKVTDIPVTTWHVSLTWDGVEKDARDLPCPIPSTPREIAAVYLAYLVMCLDERDGTRRLLSDVMGLKSEGSAA